MNVEERYNVQAGGCWVWKVIASNGYGVVNLNHRKFLAHRWMYERMVGPIPDGLQLDHLCRNRGCVNPDHLEPVTSRVNLRRGEHPNMVAWRENACTRGHEYTPENTYVGKNGSRFCRVCDRARHARRRARARARRAAVA